ncbi:MAG: DNA repair protein RecO [Candidatus Paceibacterota bacterium]
MHAIHSTPGFIIDSRAYGEAGKLLSIFTRDFGLITAAAQGIRLEKSKLRYSTQDYSFGTFSLVRGKELWRLTSASDVSAMSLRGRDAELIARIALLLRRLLQGEEAHSELFSRVESFRSFLRDNPELDQEKANTIESISALQILHALGYIGGGDDLAEFLEPACLEDSTTLERAETKRASINRHINKALKESHL